MLILHIMFNIMAKTMVGHMWSEGYGVHHC